MIGAIIALHQLEHTMTMRIFSLLKLILWTTLTVCLSIGISHAQKALSSTDLAGAKDHPAIKRYAGSIIVGYDNKRFDRVDIPTATFTKYNLTTKGREFKQPAITAEGERTQIWYESSGDTSSIEMYRNYATELAAQGFTILYDSAADKSSGRWNGYLIPFSALNNPVSTSRSGFTFYSAKTTDLFTLSAKRDRDGLTTFVHLVVVQWDKPNVTFKAQRGAYAALDIVDVAAMKQNMVSVSATEMSKSMMATGRVALYGILFDTGKSDVKPESTLALAEIAKLLKAEPALKLRVVGHTDNQGALDSNIALSKRRAEAVNATLVAQHSISAARLSAYGVADLAPVASNTSEDGRAKNRRVELVPQ
jgi:OmpA-OmpF porin, OOP family